MTGPGFWLNPANNTWVAVTRHELTMCGATALAQLSAAHEVIAAAQQISPYGRDAVIYIIVVVRDSVRRSRNSCHERVNSQLVRRLPTRT